MTGSRIFRIRQLPLIDWPAADAAAWAKACHPKPGPFGRAKRLSPFSYQKYAKGLATYLWYLRSRGLLDPAEKPGQRVTPERLSDFYDWLMQNGNADQTVLGRFVELQGALRLMEPDGDFDFVTRLDGVPIRKTLQMSRRVRFIPDSRHVALWAEALFNRALTLKSAVHRRRLVRDATFIAILATRGPRLRSILGMRLGRHLVRTPEHWKLFFDRPLFKGGRKTLELPVGSRVGALLDHYVSIERQELLDGQTHDFLWINRKGAPLSRSWATGMVRLRSAREFEASFSPHALRTALTTTQAVVDGTDPLGPSLILGHTPGVSLEHYNRATGLEASRRQDAHINEAEDAAARVAKAGNKQKEPSLRNLKRGPKRQPSSGSRWPAPPMPKPARTSVPRAVRHRRLG